MENENRQKLIEKLSAIDNAVTLPQLKKAVEEMLKFEVNLQTKTETELKTIAESVKTAISRIESLAQENHYSTSQKLSTELETMMNKMMLEHESMMSECDMKMAGMKDGEDADEEVIVEKVLSRIPAVEIPEVDEETPESVRDMIETLEGDERLDISAIKGTERYDKAIIELKSRPQVGGTMGVNLNINGVDKGNVHDLLITGSGVSTTINSSGQLVLVVTGGSGATAVETPTGTVNGVNTTFTVANAPLYIIVDGISKFPTLHYTYNAGTVEITDGAPPVQYLRSVYSA